jgi:hypothetical protein
MYMNSNVNYAYMNRIDKTRQIIIFIKVSLLIVHVHYKHYHINNIKKTNKNLKEPLILIRL